MIILKGFGKKSSWTFQGIILEFAWRDCQERRRTSVRIAYVLAEI
jgi:hypothetical protein